MPTSDEELQQLQKEVEKKREKLATADLQRTSREAELSNDIVAANLRAESARLDAALAESTRLAKVSEVKQGAEGPLAAAKADMDRALAQGKAQDDLAQAQAEQREAAIQAEKDAAAAEAAANEPVTTSTEKK